MVRRVALLLLCCLFAACAETPGDESPEPDVDPVPGENEILLRGSVEFQDVEGGCWFLRAEDGSGFQPLELPEEFRVDGLEVTAILLPRPDQGTFCMIGPVADVVHIETR